MDAQEQQNPRCEASEGEASQAPEALAPGTGRDTPLAPSQPSGDEIDRGWERYKDEGP
jgi:hypothetical protein